MLRLIGGIVAGLIIWGVGVTLLNFGLRYGILGYTTVEKSMNFTLTMMIGRLSISAIASLVSGWAAAMIAKRHLAATIAGFLLLLMFLPIHYSIWSHFPIWYHLTFLISLPLLSVVGSRFASAT
jgi:apolipoprotein N-acyltransferase